MRRSPTTKGEKQTVNFFRIEGGHSARANKQWQRAQRLSKKMPQVLPPLWKHHRWLNEWTESRCTAAVSDTRGCIDSERHKNYCYLSGLGPCPPFPKSPKTERRAHGTNTPIYFWNKVHGAPFNSASWGKKRNWAIRKSLILGLDQDQSANSETRGMCKSKCGWTRWFFFLLIPYKLDAGLDPHCVNSNIIWND